ncbi:MAG: hypothetical protein M3Q30_21555, partial [Actinomycetota bacterium]|nr:hypothetical protein [Actinomycetota bacterium]
MSFAARLLCAAATVTLMSASGCTSGNGTAQTRSAPATSASTTVPGDRPLPPRVRIRPEPEGV